MRSHRNPGRLHLNLLSLSSILQFFLFSLSSALFSPPDNHLVDCGSSSATTLHDRRVFLPDSNCRSTRLVSDYPNVSLSADPNSSLPYDDSYASLYRTARIFAFPSSYEFHINRKSAHIVRLHFNAFASHSHNLSAARFHVLASDLVLLSNFTASYETPSVKEFILRVDEEKLVITFVPASSSSIAFVNAIEVISSPEDLIGDKARLVQRDHVLTFDGLSRQAMETLFRINVGGPKVTPFNDTLWRTWVPDVEFFDSNSAVKTVTFSGRIMYQKYGASHEVAPDSVYNTARVIDVVNSSDLSPRMAWRFPVDHGYKFLIRMHFCDIASLALNELYFNVYINGYLAYEDLDISAATSQVLASPYYVDFIADVGSSGLLQVGIGPSRFGGTSRVDGLLNGLEIMKINNTFGSFDGELPFDLVLHGSSGGVSGAAVRSLICGFAFVMLSLAGFLLILRWRGASRDGIAWSPLPMDVSEGKITKGAQFV